MQDVWNNYQNENKDRFLEEMLELLRIPSVSAKSEHKADMRRCAEAVRQRLLEAGADRAEVMETAGHPVVYGEKLVDAAKPTYLYMAIMMCNPLNRWNCGRRRLLNQL
jgi:acetylornithine deacetylase/succinyl-diaminopimelate desuccinylase-like protein